MAETGILDILGNENAEAGLAQAVWKSTNRPYIGVVPVNHPGREAACSIWRGSNALPYWSYQGCDGEEAVVEVYSAAEEIALWVNGREIGREKTKGARAVFQTYYEPGEIKAVAYEADGKIYGENSLISADENVQISIRPESEAEVGSILYLDISIMGTNGQIECNRDDKIRVEVAGGKLLAFGSANPRTAEDFLSGSYTTWYGRSQAVVLVEERNLTITASGEKLGTVSRSIAAGTK